MLHHRKYKSILYRAIFLALLANPAAAHNIQVSGDVAGTWHIEPNHTPKAGEASRAWVALTRKGGKILPLEDANCQMAIYSQPRKAGDIPLLRPIVKATAVEKYQGIPGAEFVFPNTGIYQLELSCTPKTKGNFKAFQMKYDVTVAAGVAKPTANVISPTLKELASKKTTTKQEWNISTIAIATVLGLGIVATVAGRIVKR